MKKTNFSLRIGIIIVVTLLGLYKVFMPPVMGDNARRFMGLPLANPDPAAAKPPAMASI